MTKTSIAEGCQAYYVCMHAMTAHSLHFEKHLAQKKGKTLEVVAHGTCYYSLRAL